MLKNEETTINEQVEAKDSLLKDAVDNVPVAFDELKKHWQIFADKRKEEGKDSEYVLLNQEISFQEDHIIGIKLKNIVQQPTLERLRTELLQYLRKELQNQNLIINAELVKLESEDMIYTNIEKFNFLAKKYPQLKNLKDRLGLDDV